MWYLIMTWHIKTFSRLCCRHWHFKSVWALISWHRIQLSPSSRWCSKQLLQQLIYFYLFISPFFSFFLLFLLLNIFFFWIIKYAPTIIRKLFILYRIYRWLPCVIVPELRVLGEVRIAMRRGWDWYDVYKFSEFSWPNAGIKLIACENFVVFGMADGFIFEYGFVYWSVWLSSWCQRLFNQCHWNTPHTPWEAAWLSLQLAQQSSATGFALHFSVAHSAWYPPLVFRQ